MPKIKIFIINLKRSSERYAEMQRQITFLPVATEFDFIFFDAVDASTGEYLKFEKHFSRIWDRMFKGRILKDTEKACFASHYSLWKKCVELDEPIIILEDDVRFADSFLVGVKDICQSGYDLVRIFSLFGRDACHLGGNYSVLFKKVGGTQGYYITPKAAARLIEKAKTWFCPVDDYMDLVFYTRVPNVIYEPYLLSVSDAESTMPPVRSGHSGRFWKAAREVIRIFRFIWKHTYLLFNKKQILKRLSYSKKV